MQMLGFEYIESHQKVKILRANRGKTVFYYLKQNNLSNKQILDPVEECLQVTWNIDVLEIILKINVMSVVWNSSSSILNLSIAIIE